MRFEFTVAAKREADARAADRCEATGARYGLPDGVRCNADLTKTGRQRDHYPRGAHDPHPETRTASNCVVCCPEHNQYAANHMDKAVEAKIKRIRRARGPVELRKHKHAIPQPKKAAWPTGRKIESRGFSKAPPRSG